MRDTLYWVILYSSNLAKISSDSFFKTPADFYDLLSLTAGENFAEKFKDFATETAMMLLEISGTDVVSVDYEERERTRGLIGEL